MLVSDVLGTDATTLLALAEDVVAVNTCVDEVHEHGTACTIVSTERCAVSIPMRLRLAYLVDTCVTMDSVNVCNEQRLGFTEAIVHMKVACLVGEAEATQVSRQIVEQPRCEGRYLEAVVWTLA